MPTYNVEFLHLCEKCGENYFTKTDGAPSADIYLLFKVALQINIGGYNRILYVASNTENFYIITDSIWRREQWILSDNVKNPTLKAKIIEEINKIKKSL